VDPIKAITLGAKKQVTLFVLSQCPNIVRKLREYAFGRPMIIEVMNGF
jgi:hypothetical protein